MLLQHSFYTSYAHSSTSLWAKDQPLRQEERRNLDTLKGFYVNSRRAQISCLPLFDKPPPELTRSRFGGQYAWPKDDPLPLKGEGFCLAQINFAEIPNEYLEQTSQELSANLPSSGLLQVFIRPDRVFGVDDPTNGFRVAFHDEQQEFVLQPNDDYLDDIFWDKLPVDCRGPDPRMTTTGIPMAFRYDGRQAVSEYDHRIPRGNYRQGSKEYQARVNEIDGRVSKSLLQDAPCWLFGHSHFSQDDPRGWTPEIETMEALISFSSYVEPVYVWGDLGRARILVPPEDISRRLDVSKVHYSWDCS